MEGIKSIIEALQEKKVAYIVIGGIAAITYGVARGTFDIDIIVKPSKANLRRLLSTVKSLDYARIEIYKKGKWVRLGNADDYLPRVWDIFKHKDVRFSGSKRVMDMDVSLVSERYYSSRKPNTALVGSGGGKGGYKFRVIRKDDLIKMKLSAGRPQDLKDVRELKKLTKDG